MTFFVRYFKTFILSVMPFCWWLSI